MYRHIGIIVWQGNAKKTVTVKDHRDMSCDDGRLNELTQDHIHWRPLALEVANLRTVPPEHWVYVGDLGYGHQ